MLLFKKSLPNIEYWGVRTKNMVCIKCGSLSGGIYTHIFDLYRAKLAIVSV